MRCSTYSFHCYTNPYTRCAAGILARETPRQSKVMPRRTALGGMDTGSQEPEPDIDERGERGERLEKRMRPCAQGFRRLQSPATLATATVPPQQEHAKAPEGP